MKGKFKKATALLLCVLTLGSAFACNKKVEKVDESVTTLIRIIAGGGGTGMDWIRDAADRFEEQQKEHSYAEGKMGVVVETTPRASSTSLETSRSDAYIIYGIDRNNTIAAEAQRGYIVEIDDIMREKTTETRNGQPISVDDKFFDSQRSWYQDKNGKYYGVPYIENYAGISYNKDLFDEYSLYLSKDTNGKNVVSSLFGTRNYFINDGDFDNKSCGPDGKYETEDDGLPSTLIEWLCLCEYMKGEYGIDPVTVTGAYPYYSNFMLEALLVSLIGYDRYKNIVYEGDSKGEDVEIVTGFTNENLFPGIDYIKKPVTQKVKITPECGYYATWMIEKFYVDAAFEIIEKQGWWGADGMNNNASHLQTQRHFIAGNLGGNNDKIGMLSEASFWNYESVKDGNYKSIKKNVEDIDVRWMSLPVSVSEKVTPDNGLGAEPILYEYTSSYMCINSKFKDDAEHLAAAKDFLRFLMTDAELSHWTTSNFNFMPMDYEITEEDSKKLTPFYKSIANLRESNRVLYNWSDSPLFQNNMRGLFDRGWGEGQFSVGGYTNLLVPMRTNGYTAMTAFIEQLYTKEDWQKVLGYDPTLLATDYNGVTGSFDQWKK